MNKAGPDGSELPLLESAVMVDAMIQELLGITAALPELVPEVAQVMDSILNMYFDAAEGAIKYTFGESPVLNVVTRSDSIQILRTDPLFKAKEGNFQSISGAEMEAFFILEHLRIDQLLLASSETTSLNRRMSQLPVRDKREHHGTRFTATHLQFLGCLHYSLAWLASRTELMFSDVSSHGTTTLSIMTDKQNRTVGKSSHAQDQITFVAETLRRSKSVSPNGVCTMSPENGQRLFTRLMGARERMRTISDTALISLRLAHRWQSWQMMSHLTSVLLYGKSTGGEAQRQTEEVVGYLTTTDQTLLRTLPRPRCALIFAYIPQLLGGVVMDAASSNAEEFDQAGVTALQKSLSSLSHSLQRLGSLAPVLRTISLGDRIDKVGQFLQLRLASDPAEIVKFASQHQGLFPVSDYLKLLERFPSAVRDSTLKSIHELSNKST
eukprot:CAMPEP_0184315526 /NCGR_PEP_ID=MMETSP1049-20130417/83045_1 /TAXON_ID=77928 /ORGANISM="Proteomonas sulcata, Strain CCMP704" /LENGTH=437 /DNA_ID=CAMNT_0026634051 /DNA_START=38 /DNA_END=1351 /DNA_ORIENTATION=-